MIVCSDSELMCSDAVDFYLPLVPKLNFCREELLGMGLDSISVRINPNSKVVARDEY